MHRALLPILVGSLLISSSWAVSIPENVQNFYNTLKSKGSCTKKLATGFYSEDPGSDTFSYCGDHVSDYNVVYLQGTNGEFANMDIDCDGTQGSPADDGRCGHSGTTQTETSFMGIVASYDKGIKNLDANIHPYVVFGNTGHTAGWAKFNPKKHGIKPLSIMAVVCNHKVIFGVWGDENGEDGAHPMIGEASISLATACFGKSITGNNGHDANDVLYIAFPGSDAVPGANGADWAAIDYAAFEKSIQDQGNKLLKRIGSTGGGGSGSGSGTCTWKGHCTGAACSTANDCSDNLVCNSGICGPTCTWAGHCAGASCTNANDCSDNLTCKSGKCA